MAAEIPLWLCSIGQLVVFFALGNRVMHLPPTLFDQFAPWIFGRATLTASVLTVTGYAAFITGVSLLAATVAIVQRMPLGPLVVIVGGQILSQGAVQVLKDLFHRIRPDHWLFRQELGFSYPSGHATTAVAFYGGWVALVAMSVLPAPAKAVLIVALSSWAVGICWSRVALGAHFPTDVLGGALLGGAFLCAEAALLHHAGKFSA